jgi:hypothetical protein
MVLVISIYAGRQLRLLAGAPRGMRADGVPLCSTVCLLPKFSFAL